jgi:hypothetical protein
LTGNNKKLNRVSVSTSLVRCGTCKFADSERARRQSTHNPDSFDSTCVFCVRRRWLVSPTKFVCGDYVAVNESLRLPRNVEEVD